MSNSEITEAFKDVDFPKLERSLRHPRTLLSFVLSVATGVVTVIACVPLFSVIAMLLWNGGWALSWRLFVETPPTARETNSGGFGNAIVGTFVIVSIASAIAIPFGVLVATYLAEFGPNSRTADGIRFCAKTLTGLPSILAGVFVYVAFVVYTGGASAPSAGIALALLMLPTIILTAEEAMKMVPHKMKEAAIGMGCTKTQVVWRILIPTAMPGILTGVMLAVARAVGETAPLLYTSKFSQYWLMDEDYHVKFMQPTASLAVFIFNFTGQSKPHQVQMAWAASLVLVFIVLGLNICGQLYSQREVR
jgi:phosphate transport system permease protein